LECYPFSLSNWSPQLVTRTTPVIERSTNLANWSSFSGEATWIAATNAMEFFATRQLLIERVERVKEP